MLASRTMGSESPDLEWQDITGRKQLVWRNKDSLNCMKTKCWFLLPAPISGFKFGLLSSSPSTFGASTSMSGPQYAWIALRLPAHPLPILRTEEACPNIRPMTFLHGWNNTLHWRVYHKLLTKGNVGPWSPPEEQAGQIQNYKSLFVNGRWSLPAFWGRPAPQKQTAFQRWATQKSSRIIMVFTSTLRREMYASQKE